jgi:hypothetical protein
MVNGAYVRDLLSKKKKMLHISQVTQFKIPRYQELSASVALMFAQQDPEVWSYVPESWVRPRRSQAPTCRRFCQT